MSAPHTSRPFGCECGAGLHEGETHEAALAREIVEASTDCDCGGYLADDGTIVHDGFCPMTSDDDFRAACAAARERHKGAEQWSYSCDGDGARP
jgi:hypothetical protein